MFSYAREFNFFCVVNQYERPSLEIYFDTTERG